MRNVVARSILALTVGLLSAPPMSEAQQARKVPRIGYLAINSPSADRQYLEAFRQGLRELGYVEGQNIVIEYRWAEGRYDPLPDLAAELVRLNAEVIVAAGGIPSILAAKNATSTIPIVFPVAGDPVGQGLIPSLGRPGGNLTGLSLLAPELMAKRLELLKEAVPRLRRIAVLSNPNNPGHAPQMKVAEDSAPRLGVQVQIIEVRDRNELDRAFSEITRTRAGGLLVPPDSMFRAQNPLIADLAAKNRLPSIGPNPLFVEAGGLLFYGPYVPDLYRRAATYVDKILKGIKPADLPVEQPMRFELVINLTTAKTLGLTFPQSILIRADRVIH